MLVHAEFSKLIYSFTTSYVIDMDIDIWYS